MTGINALKFDIKTDNLKLLSPEIKDKRYKEITSCKLPIQRLTTFLIFQKN